jgi:hypothetical protein
MSNRSASLDFASFVSEYEAAKTRKASALTSSASSSSSSSSTTSTTSVLDAIADKPLPHISQHECNVTPADMTERTCLLKTQIVDELMHLEDDNRVLQSIGVPELLKKQLANTLALNEQPPSIDNVPMASSSPLLTSSSSSSNSNSSVASPERNLTDTILELEQQRKQQQQQRSSSSSLLSSSTDEASDLPPPPPPPQEEEAIVPTSPDSTTTTTTTMSTTNASDDDTTMLTEEQQQIVELARRFEANDISHVKFVESSAAKQRVASGRAYIDAAIPESRVVTPYGSIKPYAV